MTRIEELTLRLVDGELSDEGARELDDLLATDSTARSVFVSQLKLEGALRGTLRQPGLAGAVTERVRLLRKQRTVDGVMREIRPTVRPLPAARSWQRYALAASVLLAAGVLAVRWRAQRGPTPTSNDLAPTFATLTAGSGTVTVSHGAVRQAAAVGLALVPGDRIETAPGSGATVTYLGSSRLGASRLGASRFVLGAGATLSLDGAGSPNDEGGPRQERVLLLERGTLDAWVSPQAAGPTLAFVTPHARAVASAAGFSLAVTDNVTRLTVNEGKVVFVRRRDGRTIDVGASQYAQSDEGELAVAAPPPTPPTPPSVPDVATVFSLDFEDGQVSPAIKMGYPEPGPPRDGNRFALVGELGDSTYWVKVDREPPPLFHYSDTQVIAFDYWIGADARDISIVCWHGQRKATFRYWLTSPVHEAWGHAEIRVADMVPVKGPRVALQEGDPIDNLYIRAGNSFGKPLVIDNIKVLDYPPGAVPTSSPGGSEGKF